MQPHLCILLSEKSLKEPQGQDPKGRSARELALSMVLAPAATSSCAGKCPAKLGSEAGLPTAWREGSTLGGRDRAEDGVGWLGI